MSVSVGVGSWHTFTLNFGAAVDLFRVEQPETGQLVVHLCSQEDVLARCQYRLTRLIPSNHIPAADAGTTSLIMPFNGCYGPEAVEQLCGELGINARPLNNTEDEPQPAEIINEVERDCNTPMDQSQHEEDRLDLNDLLGDDYGKSNEAIIPGTSTETLIVTKASEPAPKSNKGKRKRSRSSLQSVLPRQNCTDTAVMSPQLIEQARSGILAVISAAAAVGSNMTPAQPVDMMTPTTLLAPAQLIDDKQLVPTSSQQQAVHVCSICGLQFNRACNLQRHVQMVHALGGRALASKICPLCHVMRCRQYKPLIHHVITAHRVAARIEHIDFPDETAFMAWKRELETLTRAYFVQKSGSKAVKSSVNTYFACNRSGGGVPPDTSAVGDGAVVKPKGKGDKESSTCIAFIRTARNVESGRIQATYCLTHLGH